MLVRLSASPQGRAARCSECFATPRVRSGLLSPNPAYVARRVLGDHARPRQAGRPPGACHLTEREPPVPPVNRRGIRRAHSSFESRRLGTGVPRTDFNGGA